MIEPIDGKILHALQMSPRSSFRRIADVIGVPEQTVARRYRAMRRDGLLRVTGVVNPSVYGEDRWIVRVHAKPDDLPRLAEALVRRPEVTHANVLSGWSELVCTVRAPIGRSSDGLLQRLGLGAEFASAWSGDPGAVTRYAVRLSQPAIGSATGGADIEYSDRIKSLDPATRTGVVIVAAKSRGRKIFGLATLNLRFR